MSIDPLATKMLLTISPDLVTTSVERGSTSSSVAYMKGMRGHAKRWRIGYSPPLWPRILADAFGGSRVRLRRGMEGSS